MVGRTVKNQQGLHGAYRLFAWQLSITLVLAAIAVWISGFTAAISAILGGLVSIIPNAYFALKLFRYQARVPLKKSSMVFIKARRQKLRCLC